MGAGDSERRQMAASLRWYTNANPHGYANCHTYCDGYGYNNTYSKFNT